MFDPRHRLRRGEPATSAAVSDEFFKPEQIYEVDALA